VASPSSDSQISEFTLVRLPDAVALHARPAGAFVRAAAAFDATIEVHANGRQANAKSILEILGLGAGGGTELAISASGDDAAAAVAQLAQLVTELS
jgi:phosphotransferase system HPr (HPr) family protein